MQEFAILAGLPGSGKSTLAARLKAESGVYVVSTDQLRTAINAGKYPRPGDGEYRLLDPVVFELAELAIRRLLERGVSVAIDATNLIRARRAEWARLARSVRPGIRVVILWCEGRWDSAERWARERGHTAEEYHAIRQQLEATVEVPTADEADAVLRNSHEPTEHP